MRPRAFALLLVAVGAALAGCDRTYGVNRWSSDFTPCPAAACVVEAVGSIAVADDHLARGEMHFLELAGQAGQVQSSQVREER